MIKRLLREINTKARDFKAQVANADTLDLALVKKLFLINLETQRMLASALEEHVDLVERLKSQELEQLQTRVAQLEAKINMG